VESQDAHDDPGDRRRPSPSVELPPEYRFDVAKATAALARLAEDEPEAPVLLTLAQLGGGGLEAESDIRLRAAEAAALLATVTEDQRLPAGGRELVVLRVTRLEDPPPSQEEELTRIPDPDSW
jgi:hypothetical protein